MPELPEVEALADHLRRHAVGLTVGRIDVSALSVLKTFDPPINVLHGQTVTGANRWGKYLGMEAGDLYLITHLSRAGWLRWSDKLAAAPVKPGKGPIALRVHLGIPGEAPGFDLTEAGTQKRLAVWLVDDPAKVPGIAALGPDALSLGPEDLAGVLAGNSGRIKTVITDQKVIAGIGNAYSDEILHRARLSPVQLTHNLSPEEIARLHAATRATLEHWIARLDAELGDAFPEKVTAFREGMAVHGRYGEPCPDCGAPVQRIVYASNETNYCARCQTGGKLLADRALSRLLKASWPKTLEELG